MRLFIFISIFLFLYTLMHAVVLWGVWPLLKGHFLMVLLIYVWIGLMVLSPILVRLLEKGNFDFWARGLAWTGFSWMGFIFLAFSLFTLLGAWEMGIWVVSKINPLVEKLSLHGRSASAIILICAALLSIYGFVEAGRIRVEKVSLVSSKWPMEKPPLRFVQVSDLHLGTINREEFLKKILHRIEALSPDLLIATGDVVDADLTHQAELSRLFMDMNPPLGKVAIFGNHEFYVGMRESLRFLKESGFQVLRNEFMEAGDSLNIVGLDEDSLPLNAQGVKELLQKSNTEKYTLLLRHRPIVHDETLGLFDLQLSGHTHGGQIFPFHIFTGWAFPRQRGLHNMGGSKLYVSRGTGSWGPPMRVFSGPEITLFEIKGAGHY